MGRESSLQQALRRVAAGESRASVIRDLGVSKRVLQRRAAHLPKSNAPIPPEKRRQVVEMRREGVPFKVIAARTGIPAGSLGKIAYEGKPE